MPQTTRDWCMRHGHGTFVLADVFDEKGEYEGEAIHCPECFPNLPEVQAWKAEQRPSGGEALASEETLPDAPESLRNNPAWK